MHRYRIGEEQAAAALLRRGGVLAYPTEAVFGLGCDPRSQAACERLFRIKQRPRAQGMLLIAGDFEALREWIDFGKLPATALRRATDSWPGPATWILPRAADAPGWIAGEHSGIALRVTAHPPAASLCRAFGGALVSTSANLHGESPARSTEAVEAQLGDVVDAVLDAPVGGATRPSTIRDVLTGVIIRA